MDKNQFAVTPPMGWNSYDYYDTTVNEEQVRANADYMAEHLKDYGWEYVVVDIQWYAHGAGSLRDRYQYIPFSELEMDGYGRLLPDPGRFPSSAGGRGFKPLADYIHSLGLKFGIHIMRGIPRMSAHSHLPVKGTEYTADFIADPSSICGWNPDMYGIRNMPEGQAYYDSVLELYAGWGAVSLLVMLLNNPNLAELLGKLGETLLLRRFGKILVHVRPLIVLTACGCCQILRGIADAGQLLEPHFCVLLLIVRRL